MTATSAAAAKGFSRNELITFAVVSGLSLLAFGLEVAGVSPVVVFAAAGVAVAGLAYVLGTATEQAGESSGPRAAALLNATFGNLAELIIVILTLRSDLIDVARASIVGSVLGNVLFILGFSILAGGLKHGTLRFNSRTAGVNASMLLIAVVALGVPTIAAFAPGFTPNETKLLSDGVAVIMLVLYAAYLVFQFQHPDPHAAHGAPRWSVRGAVAVLTVTALATGVLSEVLVESIKPTIEDTGISQVFIGLIIVPIVGNIAEHLAAVKIAYNGNIEFSMGIAFNSGLQVALGITAVAVIAGEIMGNELPLVFPSLELALLGASAVMAGLIAADGEVEWIEGLQLLSVYLLAAMAFWFL
ncbi:MAG TPA: calcium/proton exchanger [Solirubrobacteraceae bacterium]|nr:calcium/proton exchanger [Solirubrobacteraceae bacterium]